MSNCIEIGENDGIMKVLTPTRFAITSLTYPRFVVAAKLR